jgi:hypothetical protein
VTDAATDEQTGAIDEEILSLIDDLGYCRFNPPGPGMPDNAWDNLAVSYRTAWCGRFDEGVDFEQLDQVLREQQAGMS